MIRWGIVLILIFAALPARADDLPPAPVPNGRPFQTASIPQVRQFNRRVYFSGVGLLAAAKIADAITTRELLDRGGWENNPVYGRNPGVGRQAGINALFFAAEAGTFYFAEKSKHAWVRWTGRTLLGVTIANHAQAAACNAGVDVNSPAVQSCHPIPGTW